jgi:hypothetical protein
MASMFKLALTSPKPYKFREPPIDWWNVPIHALSKVENPRRNQVISNALENRDWRHALHYNAKKRLTKGPDGKFAYLTTGHRQYHDATNKGVGRWKKVKKIKELQPKMYDEWWNEEDPLGVVWLNTFWNLD